ncbi:MAG: nucleoside deaminase [Lachnospiraceae bacterium]|nr:nucleoside deaminase [Lachnospiraceae bacterium]
MSEYMKMAIKEASFGIRHGHGGPFGSVIVKDGKIVGKGHNEVLHQQDPTCHGEVMAIHDACKTLGTFDLTGCELYTTAQPCPMCLGAIMWSNVKKYYYGCTIFDTENIGFRDAVFYDHPEYEAEQVDHEACLALFEEYQSIQDKKIY